MRSNFGKLIVILIAVGCFIAYGVSKSNKISSSKNAREMQNFQMERKMQEREKEQKQANDAGYQMEEAYKKVRMNKLYVKDQPNDRFYKIQLSNAKKDFYKWADKYEQELREKLRKAKKDNNKDLIKAYETQLSSLEDMKKEVEK